MSRTSNGCLVVAHLSWTPLFGPLDFKSKLRMDMEVNIVIIGMDPMVNIVIIGMDPIRIVVLSVLSTTPSTVIAIPQWPILFHY